MYWLDSVLYMRLTIFTKIFLQSITFVFLLCACGGGSDGSSDSGVEKAEIPQIESSVAPSGIQEEQEENETANAADEENMSGGTEDWAEAEVVVAGESSEEDENVPAEYALATENKADDNAAVDFQSVNEMLVRQKQQELRQEQKEKEKKNSTDKQNNVAGVLKDGNCCKGSSGKKYDEKYKPKLTHIGLSYLFSSSGMPSVFKSQSGGKYFRFDLQPELARQKKLGTINIKAFAESKKRRGKIEQEPHKKLQPRHLKDLKIENKIENLYKGATENTLCTVCLQSREAQGRGHTGFYEQKIVLMHLKPGCPMPSPEEGLLGVWEGDVDPSFSHVEEYDCTKKVPVPEDMCTGWIVRYVCR